MMLLREINRRATWLWRLASSELCVECDGDVPVLWLFDTLTHPDGARLRPLVYALAKRDSLRVVSFGPRPSTASRVVRTALRFAWLAASIGVRQFDRRLAVRVREALENAITITSVQCLLVGSTRGTFATAIADLLVEVDRWEIQHGLLDDSYFPIEAQRFYARSKHSAEIVRRASPQTAVEVLAEDLTPPSGFLVSIKQAGISRLACYSKNPGGGCVASELALFESACSRTAERLGWSFSLHLHPRDNVLKLALRHLSLRPLAWLTASTPRDASRPILLVSAFSTSLITDSAAGDVLLNVRFGTTDGCVNDEYDWLPSIDLSALHCLSDNDAAFLRS